MLVSQKQHNLTHANPVGTAVMSLMMRPSIVTVRSPSIVISPKAVIRKSDPSLIFNQQSHNEDYPEFITPPHVLAMCNSKPPANPIIFPKMTPETPSSSTEESYSMLNTVTRKLMSLQGEESI